MPRFIGKPCSTWVEYYWCISPNIEHPSSILVRLSAFRDSVISREADFQNGLACLWTVLWTLAVLMSMNNSHVT